MSTAKKDPNWEYNIYKKHGAEDAWDIMAQYHWAKTAVPPSWEVFEFGYIKDEGSDNIRAYAHKLGQKLGKPPPDL